MIFIFLPLEKHCSFLFLKRKAFFLKKSILFFKTNKQMKKPTTLYLAFISLIPASKWDAFSVLTLPPFNTVPKKRWSSSSTCSRTQPCSSPRTSLHSLFFCLTEERNQNNKNIWRILEGWGKMKKKEKGGILQKKYRAGKAEKGHYTDKSK